MPWPTAPSADDAPRLIQVPAEELAQLIDEHARLTKRVTELLAHNTKRRDEAIEAKKRAEHWEDHYFRALKWWADASELAKSWSARYYALQDAVAESKRRAEGELAEQRLADAADPPACSRTPESVGATITHGKHGTHTVRPTEDIDMEAASAYLGVDLQAELDGPRYTLDDIREDREQHDDGRPSWAEMTYRERWDSCGIPQREEDW